MAEKAWSGSLKAMGVLGIWLTSQQVIRQRDWVRTRVCFIIIYPPWPGLVSANWTDSKRFYSLLKTPPAAGDQADEGVTLDIQTITHSFLSVPSVNRRPVHRDNHQPPRAPSIALLDQGP